MAYSSKIILAPFGRHDPHLADKEADVEADWQAGTGILGSALIDTPYTTRLPPRTRAASGVDGNHNDLLYYTFHRKTPADILMLNEMPLFWELASEAEVFDALRWIYTSLGLWRKEKIITLLHVLFLLFESLCWLVHTRMVLERLSWERRCCGHKGGGWRSNSPLLYRLAKLFDYILLGDNKYKNRRFTFLLATTCWCQCHWH